MSIVCPHDPTNPPRSLSVNRGLAIVSSGEGECEESLVCPENQWAEITPRYEAVGALRMSGDTKAPTGLSDHPVR